MKVTIRLNEASYQCLRDHLSTNSSAYKPLAVAIRLEGPGILYAVTCDEDDAKSLLAAAKRDCQTAVTPIKVALAAAQARKEAG